MMRRLEAGGLLAVLLLAACSAHTTLGSADADSGAADTGGYAGNNDASGGAGSSGAGAGGGAGSSGAGAGGGAGSSDAGAGGGAGSSGAGGDGCGTLENIAPGVENACPGYHCAECTSPTIVDGLYFEISTQISLSACGQLRGSHGTLRIVGNELELVTTYPLDAAGRFGMRRMAGTFTLSGNSMHFTDRCDHLSADIPFGSSADGRLSLRDDVFRRQ